MFKRILIYCVLALAIFAGGNALCQENWMEIVPMTVTIPPLPLTLLCDETPATWTLVPGAYGFQLEDQGSLGRVMNADPGSNVSATLTTTVSALAGPDPKPPENGVGFFVVEADGFMAPLTGRALLADIADAADITITEASTANFNIKFNYKIGFIPNDYTAQLTFVLTAN